MIYYFVKNYAEKYAIISLLKRNTYMLAYLQILWRGILGWMKDQMEERVSIIYLF